MNQELLGGLDGDCKPSSFHGGIVNSNPPPSLLSPLPSSSFSSIKTSSDTAHSEKQKLRCPRCDSPNTKFCYYNNYNLTQPRHFCKTCRRYWTKGGALRNIPIGGGCRKSRVSHVTTAAGKSSSGKTKLALAEIGRTWFGGNGFHQEFSLNPTLWDSSPHHDHLRFLRTSLNPNLAATRPATVGNSSSPENDRTMIGGLEAMTDMVARSIRLDSLNKSSAMGIYSSIWRNNELRLSSGNIFTNHPSISLANFPSSSSSSMLVSTPVAGGDLCRLNPAFSWSDLPTTDGSYL